MIAIEGEYLPGKWAKPLYTEDAQYWRHGFGDVTDCPLCKGGNIEWRIMAAEHAGHLRKELHCKDCGRVLYSVEREHDNTSQQIIK